VCRFLEEDIIAEGEETRRSRRLKVFAGLKRRKIFVQVMDTKKKVSVIFTTQSRVEADVVSGFLASCGYDVSLSSDFPHYVFPISTGLAGSEFRVCVSGDQAVKAKTELELRKDRIGADVRRRDEGLQSLEEKIGYAFKDRELLEQALTHSSRANEDGTGSLSDNESLEFLGDAVLGFLISVWLFEEFPQFTEGEKSKVKARLVSGKTLSMLGARLSIGEHLLLGKGEEKLGGRRNNSLIENAYEAVIAAIYLDGGMSKCRQFVREQFFENLTDVAAGDGDRGVATDFKSLLQEHLQAIGKSVPSYIVVGSTGPAHQKSFDIELRLDDRVLAAEKASTKKEAEQKCAATALRYLEQEND
tara:strand:- start:5 stop:1081 length:1077 start_codon:yes stop_codon:yes gene_type:complete